ncbi:MAG: glycosyltransferase [Desulfurivibrio sp.]|jgi:glycosyltransferase involved in cell wall biosynthesis|nr:MAG: glycosyltransferase [Desulfurivibrio sp.]
MKIIFVCNDSRRCGIADYSKNLLQELVKLVDVEVVRMPSLAESAGSGSPCRYLKNARQAYVFGRGIKSGDVCHVQHEYALWGGLRPLGNVFPYFAAGSRIPVLLTLHELALYRAADVRGRLATMLTLPIRPLADYYSDYVNRRMFDFPRALIVHTMEQRQELLRRGVPEDTINYIPHGIPDLDSIESDEQALQRFGLRKSSYLVIIGFISRRKGYHLAVEALKLLDGDGRLVFAGGGRTAEDRSYEEELRRFIARQGLAERVVITGYLDMPDLKALVSGSLFVLAPFHKASGSGSLSIALSLGKAVLAARLPEMEELAGLCRAVYLFTGGDPVDLAEKMKELLAHQQLRAKLEEHAGAYAARMSFKEVAAQTVAVYKKIAAQPKSRQQGVFVV